MYNPETKFQTSQMEITQFSWEKENVSQDSLPRWCCLHFIDPGGIVQAEFLLKNIMKNSVYYDNFKLMSKNQPKKWTNYFILYQDNAPCFTAHLFLSSKNSNVCLICFFTRCGIRYYLAFSWKQNDHEVQMLWMNSWYWGIHNGTAKDMKEDFLNCFRQKQEWWGKCLQNEGECFEGD